MALAGAGSVLSSCSHFDDWFLGETRNDSDKVVILGAGLAGLTAAYELKKNRVPFRVFEGSTRYGGRAWTLKGLNVSSQYADIGGEKIEPDHAAIQTLAKELKVPLEEVSPSPAFSWYHNGRMTSEKEWRTKQQALIQLFVKVSNEAYGPTPQILSFQSKDQFPKALLLDQMTVTELLARLQSQMDQSQHKFLEQLVRFEWGAEPSQISALHLVHWVRDVLRVHNGKSFRVSGGTSILTQALFDRVAGVLPERVMKFGHQLTAIRRDESGLRLIFKSPNGEVEIRTQKVICALPSNILAQIDGWERIEMAEHTRQRIKAQALGSHSKVVVGFKERFWRTTNSLSRGGVWLTDLESQNISQTGVPQSEFLSAIHGLIQSQLGGAAGQGAGLHSVQQLIKDLQKMEPKATGFENIEYVQNWTKYSWAKGSRGFLKPGQFQLTSTVVEPTDWLFAGDTAGGFSFGTMNGAVQSAVDATKVFIKTTNPA